MSHHNITIVSPCNGYIQLFLLDRHGIVQHSICGESAECDPEIVRRWQAESLPEIIKDYAPEDIYNADETGLFYKCLPDKTLCFKGEKCFGGKQSKERLTVLPVCNWTGSHKMRLLVIGKSANPRCFKNAGDLPVDYVSNKKAWMTEAIFRNWLFKLDKEFFYEGRKILLFIDNCPSHSKSSINHELKSVKLVYLPPNYTSKLQPLDAGIIQNLKHSYRKRILANSIRFMEETNSRKTVDVLEAIRTVADAWHTDVKPETIQNCFRKAGFGEYTLNDPINTLIDDDRYEIESDDLSNDAIPNMIAEYIRIGSEKFGNDFVQPETILANDYLQIDYDIATSSYPEDDEILKETVNQLGGDIDQFTFDANGDLDEDDPPDFVEYQQPDLRDMIAGVEQALLQSSHVPSHLLHSLYDIRDFLLPDF